MMPTWKPFELMAMPVMNRDHVDACSVCQVKMHWSAVALHEATHLAVALERGVTVEFCSIDDNQEVEASRLEAQLYPLVGQGTPIPAVLTRLAADSLDVHPVGTLVAMCAPSFIETDYEPIDTYAEFEKQLTVRMAKSFGFDADMICLEAQESAERQHRGTILTLAARLAREGRIDL